MTPPKQLFRYFSPKASNIFTERKLWFSAVKDFNDPFDVAPRHDELADESVGHAIKIAYAFGPRDATVGWREFKKRMEPHRKRIAEITAKTGPTKFQAHFSEHYGVVCFCEKGFNLLMWGHYAGRHAGFVVEFDPQHALFSAEAFQKVEYSAHRPRLDEPDCFKLLLTKGLDWEYEAEHRLVRLLSELTPGSRCGQTKYFTSLPLEAVKAAYLGCRIEPKTSDEIVHSLQTPSTKHIRLFNMQLHPVDYALEPVEFAPITSSASASPASPSISGS